jgi:hypothetical protein
LGGDFLLTHKPDPRPAWNPALYDFTPADQFDIHGTYVTEHERKEGVGASTVATGRGMNENARKDFTIPRIFYGITVLIRFEGRRAVAAFEDLLATERVILAGRSFPLAADYTVPLAVMLASRSSNSAACCGRENTPRPPVSRGFNPTTRTRPSCSWSTASWIRLRRGHR